MRSRLKLERMPVSYPFQGLLPHSFRAFLRSVLRVRRFETVTSVVITDFGVEEWLEKVRI
jgi:hypothetical protein